LANLAADDKCSMEVALAGGVHALVMLARNCKFEGVQEQVWYFLLLGDILCEKVHTKISTRDIDQFTVVCRLNARIRICLLLIYSFSFSPFLFCCIKCDNSTEL
jgi:hypothetical protein